eukprot:7360140-Prymnesium_polylepis.2
MTLSKRQSVSAEHKRQREGHLQRGLRAKDGGSGVLVDVFDTNGAALPCKRDFAVSGTPTDRVVDHVCLGAIPTAADVYALSEASRVRITLAG